MAAVIVDAIVNMKSIVLLIQLIYSILVPKTQRKIVDDTMGHRTLPKPTIPRTDTTTYTLVSFAVKIRCY